VNGKARSRTAAAFRAVGASYVTKAVTILLGFVVTPIVLGYVGRDLYGFWVIVGSVIGYVGMVDFGVTGSVATLIARQQGSIESVNRISTNALVVNVATGCVAFLLALVTSRFGPDFLNVSPEQHTLFSNLILLAGTGLAISFPVRTLKAVFRGTQRIATLRVVEFFLMLVRTCLMLFLLFLGSGIMALPLSAVASSVLSLFVFSILTRRRIPGFRIRISAVAVEELGPILSVSAWWFLGNLSALLIYQTDNIILGKYLGSGAVTTYALTYRASEMIRAQIYQLNIAVTPGLGELVGRNDLDRLRKLYLSGFRVMLFLGVAAAILILKLNRGFVTLWVGGENYGGNALNAIFCASLAYLVVFHVTSVFLTNLLELKVMAGARVLEGILNLVLSLLLVRTFGLLGVAAGTLIAGLLTSAWYLPRIAFNRLQIDGRRWVREISGRMLIFLAGAAIVYWTVPDYSEASWGGLVWRGLVLSVGLILVGWWSIFPRAEVMRRFSPKRCQDA